MAGQHWGERGNPDERVTLGRLIEWTCVGFSILIAVSQAGYGNRFADWPVRRLCDHLCRSISDHRPLLEQ